MARLDPAVRQIIEDVIREHGSQEQLPTLADPSTGIGLSELLGRYFENLFGGKGTDGTYAPNFLGKALIFVIEHIEWVIFAVIVAIGWYFILQYLRTRKEGWRSAYGRDLHVVSMSSAREGLEIALSRGNYSEATRWRWRLMLEMSGVFHAITPLEYLATEPAGSQLIKEPLVEIYRLMFSPASVSEEQYRWFADLMDRVGQSVEPEQAAG